MRILFLPQMEYDRVVRNQVHCSGLSRCCGVKSSPQTGGHGIVSVTLAVYNK